jgi:hypothetical protein
VTNCFAERDSSSEGIASSFRARSPAAKGQKTTQHSYDADAQCIESILLRTSSETRGLRADEGAANGRIGTPFGPAGGSLKSVFGPFGETTVPLVDRKCEALSPAAC